MEYLPRPALPLPMKWELLVYTLAALTLIAHASAEEFNPRQVVKAFDAITSPEIVSAEQGAKFVRDDELILGVVLGKEARAYPINMLTNPTREIINDKLGGRAIAATW